VANNIGTGLESEVVEELEAKLAPGLCNLCIVAGEEGRLVVLDIHRDFVRDRGMGVGRS